MRTEARDALLQRMPNGGVCAEIGVGRGDFSAQILDVTHPTRLHLIDPWKHETGPLYRHAWYGGGLTGGQSAMDALYDEVLARFAAQRDTGTVAVHRAQSSEAVTSLPDAGLDWVYIHGNHQFEYVLADLEQYTPKIKSGGYITGDDFGKWGWWDNGVERAVDAFLELGHCELVAIDGDQFILRRR
jgi:hypothetical protein